MSAPDFTKPRAGEIWQVSHTRKGQFQIKFLADEDMATDRDDDFISVEVVSGKPIFISLENRMNEAGSIGDTITVRKSMITLNYRIDPPDA